MMTEHGTLPTVTRMAAVLALAFFAACADENEPPAGLHADRAGTLSGQQGAPVYPEERPFWNLAQTFPSSAGFFRDPVTDDIVVSLTDMRDAAAVRAVLRSSLAERLARARKRNPRADVVARQATYTFLQLKEWRDRMGQAFAIAGVDWLDLDEAKNRVMLGIDPGTNRQPIRRLARDLGVPEKAVDFEVDGPAVPRLALTDSVRPVAGGTEIQSDNAAHTIRRTCTLGFPALWNGTRAFVTASHCSRVKFAVDSTPQYQPTLPLTHTDSMNHSPIGFEVADYTLQPCPPGVNGTGCVYADAAVYQYTGDTTQWYLGHIAEPTYGCAPGPCSPPNLQILGYFSITGTDSNIMQNDLVSLIGEETGWDQHFVSSSCVISKVSGASYRLLCQELATFGNGDGDSGGPVLLNIFPPPDSTVTLGGIFWGSSPQHATFSPWSGILQEYPGLVVH
ncbi:MAG TPA: hypothetical protein VEK85_04610 [Gemmatimonadales bacterium]|nr:hypothetical protein [Gemmatimonadales bacterium]